MSNALRKTRTGNRQVDDLQRNVGSFAQQAALSPFWQGNAVTVALGTLTTKAVAHGLGRVYRGRMVDMNARNAKLERRAERMLAELADATPEAARAALAKAGGKVKLATLDGDLYLKVPAGAQSGKVFKLEGKGVPYLRRKSRGDLFVTIHVSTPERLSRKQKQALREFTLAKGEELDSGWF